MHEDLKASASIRHTHSCNSMAAAFKVFLCPADIYNGMTDRKQFSLRAPQPELARQLEAELKVTPPKPGIRESRIRVLCSAIAAGKYYRTNTQIAEAILGDMALSALPSKHDVAKMLR